MLADARTPGPPAPAFVLDHHRMLDLSMPRCPRSPRMTPRSPRLGLLASPKSGGGGSSTSSRPSTLAMGSRPGAAMRPVFDFVRTAGGRPLSLPYSMDHGLQARPSPPPSLLDSLSLTEDVDHAEHGDQDNSPAPSLIDSPRLTPVSSLMDSNSLARVARLRQPAMLDSYQALPAIKRGVLWQQRERLWSRWKERYFILTSDYLHCFKRRSAGDGLSQMGHFIFKIRLVDLEAVEWVNRRSYSVVALTTRDRARVLLRAATDLEDWFELLEECTIASKQRRRALYDRHPAQFDWSGSLQRESSLSMSPGVEVLLRRRLEEQEQERQQSRDRDRENRERDRDRERGRERDEQWRPSLFQRKQPMLTDLGEPSPPPSAPATFRSPTRAPRAGPPLPPPAAPYQPPLPPPGLAPGSTASGRQPVYHRLNHDVFFMAADRPVGDNLSWRSRDYHRRHTQV